MGKRKKNLADKFVDGLENFFTGKQDRAAAESIISNVEEENKALLEQMAEDTQAYIDTKIEEGLSESEAAVANMLSGVDTVTEEGLASLYEIYTNNIESISTITGKSVDELGNVVETTKDVFAPYLDLGEKSAAQWQKAMGLTEGFDSEEFLSTLPGYNFRVQQGQRAIYAGASARGGMGGRAAKELLKYGQGLASEYWGDYMKSLEYGIDVGRQTAVQRGQLLASLGTAYSQGVENLYGRQQQAYTQAGAGYLANVGSLYSAGTAVGAQSIMESATGIAEQNMRAAEARIAALFAPTDFEKFMKNVNVNIPVGGGSVPGGVTTTIPVAGG